MGLHAQNGHDKRTGCAEMCLGGGRCNRRRGGFALWSWPCFLRGTAIVDQLEGLRQFTEGKALVVLAAGMPVHGCRSTAHCRFGRTCREPCAG